MMMRHILIVCGGGPDECPALRAILEKHDSWELSWAPSLQELPRILSSHLPKLVLLLLPPEGGSQPLESLAELLRGFGLSVPIMLVLSDKASEEDVRRLPEVADFLVEPLRPFEVRARIRRLLDREHARGMAETSVQLTERLGLNAVVGEDPVFAGIKAKLPLIARAEATVLISGETGTGKEVVARAIHYLSRRVHGPFLPVNCGAIPTELFENELFGHRRGAFTDARSSTAGLIADAEGGTLFLDEVEAVPLLAQVKLLQFLQHKVYRPLGNASLQHANVRIIAATNADLEAKVKVGVFREDLYYRLNIIPLVLPPLRERRADIPPLARHFLHKYTDAESEDAWQFAPEVLELLQAYSWRGNIRELENLIQQIVALMPPGLIGIDTLPPRFRPQTVPRPPVSFREDKAQAVVAFERDYTTRLLSIHNGNITRAAQAGRMERRAFGRLVKKYRIAKALTSVTQGLGEGGTNPSLG